MKILAFAASNSKQSINKQLVSYSANQLAALKPHAEIEILDLNDYEMPIYSIDREQESGIPQKALDFLTKIKEADLLMISFAEHNGNYSSAYKNIFDWSSRSEQKIFQQTNTILMATSPGARGGLSVLELAKNTAPFFGANLLGTLSIPSFYDNFDSKTQTLTNEALQTQLVDILKTVEEK